MRLRRLHLRAFGPFTNRILDFGDGTTDLILVLGPNEAGKSSALRAISDLRFGIPTKSTDDFIHSHPTMRVGGEFLAPDGSTCALMRRKGRNNTLHQVDLSQAEPGTDRPASMQIEEWLTGGLSKEQHDSMFGINHERLRAGGEALLNGNGEVGAALFEASAGIRSAPAILSRLDENTRRLYIPGGRAKKAVINEALIDYDQQQSNFRTAQVRPNTWADLWKEMEASTQALASIDQRSRAVHEELRLIAEIRAVVPLLSALTTAEELLEELKAAPVLTASAETERAAAQQGLSDAKSNESRWRAEVDRQTALLGTLRVEEPILAFESSVRRLVAAVDRMEVLERDKANAEADVRRIDKILTDLCREIDAGKSREEIVSGAPMKVERAEMERLLRRAEGALSALEGHATTKPDLPGNAEPTVLPPEEIREHLKSIMAEVSRSDAHLRRLDALPTEIETARRSVTRYLAGVALDETEYSAVRPLFDSQIDEAINRMQALETRKQGLDARVVRIHEEIENVSRRRDRLLQEGTVPTRSEVLAARGLRDAAWNMVRHAYIDDDAPASTLIDDTKRIPTEYEITVKDADAIVDSWAGDSKRAAEYEGCLESLNSLRRDRGAIETEISTIASEVQAQSATWTSLLMSQNLPALSPAALREWQARLPALRTAIDTVEDKMAEHGRLLALSSSLKEQLEAAIPATMELHVRAGATLTVLTQLAARIEADWVRAQESAVAAEAERKERATALKRWERRAEELTRLNSEARGQVTAVLPRLSLPASTSYEAVSIRIQELGQIIDLHVEMAAADSSVDKATAALTALSEAANRIATHLDEQADDDVRQYTSGLLTRLEKALEQSSLRQMATRTLESAVQNVEEHSAIAHQYLETLKRLCRAAGVQEPRELPMVELQSARKREALVSVDKTKAQLAAASKRSISDLRQLVAARDLDRLDEDEHARIAERDEVDKSITAARERQQRAKAKLDQIDSSDVAAAARGAAEQAAARVRANMSPWIRSKLAHSLLSESLKRFRERAQGPMLKAASKYFERMTCGNYVTLTSEEIGEKNVLVAQRTTGARIYVGDMSEGTRDQLYLSLRLAALDFRRAAGVDLPIMLDDILITSDDERTTSILEALSESAKSHQVMVFTHHNHIINLARRRFVSGIQVVELA